MSGVYTRVYYNLHVHDTANRDDNIVLIYNIMRGKMDCQRACEFTCPLYIYRYMRACTRVSWAEDVVVRTPDRVAVAAVTGRHATRFVVIDSRVYRVRYYCIIQYNILYI